MDDFEIIEQLYQGHYCSNCSKKAFCKKNPIHHTCIEWEKEFDVSSLLSVVRAAFPTMISGEIVSSQPMKPPSDNIFYLKPIYTKDEEKNETT